MTQEQTLLNFDMKHTLSKVNFGKLFALTPSHFDPEV